MKSNHDDFPQLDGCPIVPAYAVDMTHIYFKCPYSKKLTFHLHGSCGDLTNRLEHRGSHSKYFNNYYLNITDDTIRANVRRSGYILKRSIPFLKKMWDKQILKKEKV
tara:strand:+ start:1107 stop:1427 length:321 start_codon:yes stop_codon:yes gene_type:complete